MSGSGKKPASTGPRPLMPLWLGLVLAVVGGALLDVAHPGIGAWPLAFVAVAVALTTLIGRSIGGALLVGLAFGLTFYLLHVSWASLYLGPVPWLALGGLEGALMAVAGLAIMLGYRALGTGEGRAVRLVALPALIAGLWSARELFLANWPYTGFPWARIAVSQSESPFAGLVSWVGITGAGFVMVFLVAVAVEIVRIGGWRSPVAFVPAVAALVVLLLPQWPTTATGTIRVGSVQGDGPAGYFDDRRTSSVLQAQLDATAPLYGEQMDVLLWPEGGVDRDPLSDARTARVIEALADRVEAPVILNAATARGDDVYNTTMLWYPGQDAPESLHDKRFPVPFGEYVPDRWFYEMLVPDLIGLIQREYTPGGNPPVFDVSGVRVGLAICFDVIYDEVIWEGAREGAEVFMFQTNNADFRGTDENLQQLAVARLRAVETGRAVVNISTVGTSQVIDADGRTLDALPSGEPGAMLTDVPVHTGLTPAVVAGAGIQLVLGAGSVLALVVLLLGRAWTRRRSRLSE